MEKLKSYKDLQIWKVSMDFVVEVYKLTDKFPSSELYGLTSQIRRSSVSIPSNIAEGSCRKNTKEYIQFIYISNGSLSEVETQLEIANKLGYFTDIEYFNKKIRYMRAMLVNLIYSLQRAIKSTLSPYHLTTFYLQTSFNTSESSAVTARRK
jgi:four helix bundle protein